MTSETPGEGMVTAWVSCPRCEHELGTDGDTRCLACGAEVLRFRRVEESVKIAPGTGRCAVHASKDAVDGCSRCGAFVCDLCRTRTGGRVFCPACFDALHERGELETTRPTRFRIDRFAVGALVLMLVPPFGCLALPISLGAGIWGLVRAQREPWISRGYCIAGALLSGGLLLVGGLAIGGAFK